MQKKKHAEAGSVFKLSTLLRTGWSCRHAISRQLHLTCSGDGLRGHLKRRLWLILAHRVLLTRRYLTRTCCSTTAHNRNPLASAFLRASHPASRVGQNCGKHELTANLQKHSQQRTAETPSPRTTSRSPTPARERTCAPTMGILPLPTMVRRASIRTAVPQPCKPSPALTACHPRPDGPLRPHGEITLLQASTARSAHLRSRYCPRGSAPAPHPRPVPSARQCKRKSYESQQLSQSSPSRQASAKPRSAARRHRRGRRRRCNSYSQQRADPMPHIKHKVAPLTPALAPKHRTLLRMPIDAVKTARQVGDICSHTAQSWRISSRTQTTVDVAEAVPARPRRTPKVSISFWPIKSL